MAPKKRNNRNNQWGKSKNENVKEECIEVTVNNQELRYRNYIKTLTFADAVELIPKFSGGKDENIKQILEEFEEISEISEWSDLQNRVALKSRLMGKAQNFIYVEEDLEGKLPYVEIKKKLLNRFHKRKGLAPEQHAFSIKQIMETETIEDDVLRVVQNRNNEINVNNIQIVENKSTESDTENKELIHEELSIKNKNKQKIGKSIEGPKRIEEIKKADGGEETTEVMSESKSDDLAKISHIVDKKELDNMAGNSTKIDKEITTEPVNMNSISVQTTEMTDIKRNHEISQLKEKIQNLELKIKELKEISPAKVTCQICSKQNHSARTCWYRNNSYRKNNDGRNKKINPNKYCNICHKNNHLTYECYYNKQNSKNGQNPKTYRYKRANESKNSETVKINDRSNKDDILTTNDEVESKVKRQDKSCRNKKLAETKINNVEELQINTITLVEDKRIKSDEQEKNKQPEYNNKMQPVENRRKWDFRKRVGNVSSYRNFNQNQRKYVVKRNNFQNFRQNSHKQTMNCRKCCHMQNHNFKSDRENVNNLKRNTNYRKINNFERGRFVYFDREQIRGNQSRNSRNQHKYRHSDTQDNMNYNSRKW